MKGRIGKIIYIALFAILYLVVAGSSLWHAIEFFGLANGSFMALILAFAFEVGQAAVLFALLTSSENRGKVMPWILMTMFTLVQVLGNVYSSYKHIILNSTENLRFFKEPIFIWTTIPDNQATVIITYLVGGLLPISSLLLTSMMTSYLNSPSENSGNILNLPLANSGKESVEKIEEEPAEEMIPESPGKTDETPTEQMVTDTVETPVEMIDDSKKTHFVSME